MNNPNVLIVASTPLHNSPRIIKEIRMLEKFYHIYTIGSSRYDDLIEFIPIERVQNSILDKIQRKVFHFFRGYSTSTLLFVKKNKIHRLLSKISPKIVIVHDPYYLPYFTFYKKKFNFKIVFNAHEFHPLEYQNRPKWMSTTGKYLDYIYSNFLSDIDLMLNVSNGIVQLCIEKYKKSSLLIPNAADYVSIKSKAGVSKSKIKLIHHGLPIKERQLENMIKAVSKLSDRYTLDLMIVDGNDDYTKFLKQLVSTTKNVKIIPIVNYDKIVEFISQYDIGIYSLPPTNINHRFALPNKFFEFIQARLCLLIGPSEEMAPIVNKYKIGKVAFGFNADSLFEVLYSLENEEILNCKMNTEKAAFELSSDKFYGDYLEKVNNLI
jgi:hypothetical protein